ncbi:MAG: YdcF family protein [Anaerolineae bacterium]
MMKRYLKIVFWVGLVSAIIWLMVVVALASAVQQAGRDDQAQPADVIVVLGSGLRRDGRPGDALYRRSVWGARLFNQGYADQIICTGGVGEGRTRSEADACREVLMQEGVPASAIALEEQSRSTEENAIYAGDIMQANAWETAVLVTDSFHMLRASWIFDTHDITHYPSPVPREWVRDYFYNRHFTRELLALHWQAVKEALNLPFTNI